MAVVNKNYWQRRNVLITGCSGLVGGWLTKELVEAGADVVALPAEEQAVGRTDDEGDRYMDKEPRNRRREAN